MRVIIWTLEPTADAGNELSMTENKNVRMISARLWLLYKTEFVSHELALRRLLLPMPLAALRG